VPAPARVGQWWPSGVRRNLRLPAAFASGVR
jgi:hypothetical protein